VKKEKKQGFLKGAAILAFAGILVKIIGACYKIPLGALLGPVGMANFSLAYNIYALLFVLSTAGVPAAVSKMISESSAKGMGGESAKIYRIAHLTFMVVGFTGFAVMFFFAEQIAKFMGSRDAAVAIRVISPSVLFVSVSAINRGYFQGKSNMYPTAVSEVLEALGKLFAGLCAAWYLKRIGAEDSIVSAGAVFGVSAGAFLSALYFAFCKTDLRGKSLQNGRRMREILAELAGLAVPITLGASVMSLTNVIDSALVMNLLQKNGFSEYQTKWFYGAYNYAATIFNLPSALITTMSASLIPAIASANAQRDRIKVDKYADAGLSLAMMVAVPAACGIAALSDGILKLLFGTGIDSDCIRKSADLLCCLCLAIPTLSLVTITSGMHQALGNAKLPVYSMIVGALIKVLSNLVLVSNSRVNIFGAAISTVLCYLAIAILNIAALRKYPFIEISISRVFAKPMVMGVSVFLSASCTKRLLNATIGTHFSTIAGVFAGVLICVVCAFCVGAIGKKELKMLFGEKSISKFLNND